MNKSITRKKHARGIAEELEAFTVVKINNADYIFLSK